MLALETSLPPQQLIAEIEMNAKFARCDAVITNWKSICNWLRKYIACDVVFYY